MGVAELIATHDDHFEAQVLEQADPAAQLDTIIRTVSNAEGHGAQESAALRATSLPKPER